jgi:DNA-binding transcriptional ArsR family regulator
LLYIARNMATSSSANPNDLFTALGHPLRRKILRTMLNGKREASPRQLSTDLEEPLSALSYHVRVLAECGAIELVGTAKVRGSTQHFYRTRLRARWARSALKATEGPGRGDKFRGEEKG